NRVSRLRPSGKVSALAIVVRVAPVLIRWLDLGKLGKRDHGQQCAVLERFQLQQRPSESWTERLASILACPLEALPVRKETAKRHEILHVLDSRRLGPCSRNVRRTYSGSRLEPLEKRG